MVESFPSGTFILAVLGLVLLLVYLWEELVDRYPIFYYIVFYGSIAAVTIWTIIKIIRL